MSFLLGTALLAVVTAVACALPGAFVVLRKNSMLVDAIGHSVFPGIVVGYFFTRDMDSPVLIVGAALAGLVVVLGSEWLARTGLLSGDAPQGLVFPALFSAGVILVTLNFGNVHLDTHAVLVGDLNLAAFGQLAVAGVDLGPRYLYVMVAVLLVDAAFIAGFLPQLTVSTFDPQFARTVGVRAGLLQTAFMFLVSLTVTAAFNAAGAILVVALVVVPAATAHLVTRRLPAMLALTVLIAAGGALVGFGVAYRLGTATSASMAVFYGLLFACVAFVARRRGRKGADGTAGRGEHEKHGAGMTALGRESAAPGGVSAAPGAPTRRPT